MTGAAAERIPADIVARMRDVRQDVHRHPELAFEEFRTAGLVADALAMFGLDVHRGIAGTGVVGVLSNGDGPSLALRADMDALPVTEASDLSCRSEHPGRMHACGHDGHTAMLLGAAEHLAQTRNFAGSVVFVFQPAEENAGGAKAMIEDGLYARFPFQAIFGMHNFPGLPVGQFGSRSGAFLASFDKFSIALTAGGGHSSAPHEAPDLVHAGASLVHRLTDLPRTHCRATSPTVLSVTQFHAGSDFNVIPDRCEIRGSFRSLDPGSRDILAAAVHRAGRSVAALYGCECCALAPHGVGYPVLVNAEAETGMALEAASKVAGRACVAGDIPPLLGSEDFAFFLLDKPGSFIGIGNGEGEYAAALHSPRYRFNDGILPQGAAYWVALAEAWLSTHR